MNGLLTFYLACFAFGLLATLVEFLLGKVFSGKFSRRQHSSWFNLSALLIFLTWLGGTGFVVKSLGIQDFVSFIIALLCGLAGYIGFVILLNQTSPSAAAGSTPFDNELTGTLAKVSNPILENSVGQIYFTKHGTRRVIPAKCINGMLLGLGTQVVIIRLEHGVAYVEEVKYCNYSASLS